MPSSLASLQARLLCPDVLFEILDALDTRHLLRMRSTSKQFYEVIGCLIRRRFTSICTDPSYELVFESIPTHGVPGNKRQVVEFAHFVGESGPGRHVDTAELVFRDDAKTVHHVALDDDESFSSHLISLHLRASDSPKAKPSSLSAFGPLMPEGPQPIPMSPAGGRNWSYRTPQQLSSAESSLDSSPASSLSLSGSPRRRFAFTLSLADGLERFFRDWFEDDSLDSAVSHAATTTMRRDLSFSGAGSLVSASIAYRRRAPKAMPSVRNYATSPFGDSTVYEFTYESIRLDASRLVVKAEEGLSPNSMRGTIMLWLRT